MQSALGGAFSGILKRAAGLSHRDGLHLYFCAKWKFRGLVYCACWGVNKTRSVDIIQRGQITVDIAECHVDIDNVVYVKSRSLCNYDNKIYGAIGFIMRAALVADRTLSVCSGSVLAAAGVLDGKRATSHWERSDLVSHRFPQVNWQLDHIFTQDGKFHCSAGVTAGVDLALSILEHDHGRQLALDVAREMVVFIRRNGGQSQFSRPLQAQSTANQRLSELYSRIEANPAGDWTVQNMADVMGTTERTLHRDFVRDLKISPSRFVEQRRVGIARTYLEQSTKTLKEIAALSGFSTEQKMRRSFQKLLGVLPSEYTQNFGCNPTKT